MKSLKPYLPHLIIVSAFIVISYVYFYPVLEGKVLKANDASVSDYNSKEIRDYRAAHGKDPLWTNSIFSGMPGYLILTRHPGNLMRFVDRILRAFKMPVSVLFLAMAGFYVLLLLFGVDPWLAFIGAIAYGLSSFLFQILAAGHNTQAIALAYMAPMIGGIYYSYRKDVIKGALFTAVILSLQILANHPQITYYALMCLLVFVIMEFVLSIKQKTIPGFLKTSVILIVPFIIAVGINFSNLYTVYEYGKYSIRGKSDLVTNDKNVSSGLDRDYITMWSYGVDETFNLLIPNYKGGSGSPFSNNSKTVRVLRQNGNASAAGMMSKYWGTQPGTDGPHYVGAIIFFLFILGLFIVKGPEKWWLLIATVISVMLSWGRNFMPLTNLFIDFFPGYNKFRSVTMILVISQFCIPLLGVLALKDIFNGSVTRKDLLRGFKIAGGATAGFLLLTLIVPGIAGSFINPGETNYPQWLKDALVSDRKELLRSDSLRSLIFIILGAGVIYAFINSKIKKEYALLILGFLIMADLWMVDKRYLNADRFKRPAAIKPSPADNIILNDKSYYRVLNLSVSTFNDNSPTSYFHKSIGGYHGAKMERYKELIDSSLTGNINLFIEASQNARSLEDFQPVFNKTFALNMLNAKYVIINPGAEPLVNHNTLGNAWFAEKPVIVENANAELAALNAIDPGKTAVIDRIFSDQVRGSAYPVTEGEKIELVSYQPNELKYKYTARSEKLVVFSEIYYPAGWRCFIDGRENSYFRADYVLRAMIAPPGDHEIRFSFEPASYAAGNKVSLASSLLLILLILAYAGYLIRKK